MKKRKYIFLFLLLISINLLNGCKNKETNTLSEDIVNKIENNIELIDTVNDIKEKSDQDINLINETIEELKKNEENKLELQTKEESKTKEDEYFTNLEKGLIELTSSYGDKISVSFTDIKSRKHISINGDKQFLAASTTKIPLTMVVADKLNEGSLKLEDKVFYIEDDFESGTGIIQSDIKTSYPISTLLDYSIIYSDNIATNMLYRHLGGYTYSINKFYAYLGILPPTYENVITSNQANKYLEILYDNKNNNPYYDRIIENMKKTVFKNRMETNLQGLVAHKIGTYSGFINDIGIVYGDNPFILSIYTNNLVDSENLITKITDYIYKNQSTLY